MRRLVRMAMAAAAAGGIATAAPAAPAAPAFSVLTYNVEGLPWPVRSGRDDDLLRIATSLRRLRAVGRQPQVIVLQEAFTPAAKAIAGEAGYRYVADGPGRDEVGAAAVRSADRAFAAQASALSGERAGKWVDSGLRIASDYPILGVRRMPFPAFACAGYDCLANKGVLMVLLRVPGVAGPVAVIATHLNSRAASGVAFARADYAYRRQVDAVGGFLHRALPPGMPFVLAGDFNAGQGRDRRGYLVRSSAYWRPHAPLGMALGDCLAPDSACRHSDDADVRWSFRRGRDWQFFSAGTATALAVTALSAPFGHIRDAMLSDHVGYVAYYRLTPEAAVTATTIPFAARS